MMRSLQLLYRSCNASSPLAALLAFGSVLFHFFHFFQLGSSEYIPQVYFKASTKLKSLTHLSGEKKNQAEILVQKHLLTMNSGHEQRRKYLLCGNQLYGRNNCRVSFLWNNRRGSSLSNNCRGSLLMGCILNKAQLFLGQGMKEIQIATWLLHE
jgi:hypothetical protein